MLIVEKRATWQGSYEMILNSTKRKEDPGASGRPQIGSVRQDSRSQLHDEAP